jgi:hypothetical protein
MTTLEIYNFSVFLSSLGSLIIGLSCFPKFSKRAKPFKVLGLYILITLFLTIVQYLLIYIYQNRWLNQVGNTFVVFEAVLLCLTFSFALGNKGQKLFFIYIIAYLIYCLTVFLLVPEKFYSSLRLGRDVILITSALTYFYFLIVKLPEENLLRFPMFWISAGVMFYFSGTFILSFFIDYITKVLRDDTTSFWAFRNFFRFGFCLVLAYAGWLDLQLIKRRPI